MPALLAALLAGLLWLTHVNKPEGRPVEAPPAEDARAAYGSVRLEGVLAFEAFAAAYERWRATDDRPRHLAIADMTVPSTERRFVVVDLEHHDVVLHTWVAHGEGSGELMATAFGNGNGSHRTSLGLYRVGRRIVSPKHGPALLLHGLDPGVNCRALEREIIVHGADYVSERFIREHGRLGRSWGCPALPREHMATAIALLADGGLLYIHGR